VLEDIGIKGRIRWNSKNEN